MPPTIILTVGSVAEADPDEPVLVDPLLDPEPPLLQAARLSDRAAPTDATATMLLLFMVRFLSWCRGIRRSGGTIGDGVAVRSPGTRSARAAATSGRFARGG